MITQKQMKEYLYATNYDELELLMKDGTKTWVVVHEISEIGIIIKEIKLCKTCNYCHDKFKFIPYTDILDVTDILSK